MSAIHVIRSLTNDADVQDVQVIVSSFLDYYNSLLYSIYNGSVIHLHAVQNAAAYLDASTTRYESSLAITLVLFTGVASLNCLFLCTSRHTD